MLIDDGLLRFEDGRMASRRRPRRPDRAAHDPAAARRAARPARCRGARGDRTRCRRGEGVPHGGRHLPRARGPAHPGATAAARARAQGADPSRPGRVRGEDAFRFRHLLIRDAAYQAMPKEQRAELHERFAALAHRRRRATRSPSTRRSSATTWSRRTGTGASSARRRSHASVGARRGAGAARISGTGRRPRRRARRDPSPRTDHRTRRRPRPSPRDRRPRRESLESRGDYARRSTSSAGSSDRGGVRGARPPDPRGRVRAGFPVTDGTRRWDRRRARALLRSARRGRGAR